MFELRRVESSAEKLLLNVRQASQALSVSPRTLWTLTANGEIPSVRFGRSVRYDPADLRRWIDSKKVVPAAPLT